MYTKNSPPSLQKCAVLVCGVCASIQELSEVQIMNRPCSGCKSTARAEKTHSYDQPDVKTNSEESEQNAQMIKTWK